MRILKNIFGSKNDEIDSSNSVAKRTYFKVLNFNNTEGKIDHERLESMREYDGEYNYELDNEYFENARFFSHADEDLIQFQIFYTKHAHFRYPDFYNNPQAIQDYYEKKYDTPFFFALSNGELKKKYHPSLQLGKHLTLEDFKSIILPNLNLKLLSTIDIEVLDSNHIYVFHNWDFYEETQISPFSNSFLRFIENLPYSSRKHFFETMESAKIGAYNTLLENGCSTVDTILRGLNFDLDNSESKSLKKESYSNNNWVIPLIRNLSELEEQTALEEIDNATKLLEQYSMRPFEIVKYS